MSFVKSPGRRAWRRRIRCVLYGSLGQGRQLLGPRAVNRLASGYFAACDLVDGSAGNGLRFNGMANQHLNHFRVRDLGEVGIEKPDCAEIFIIFKANDVVGFALQLLQVSVGATGTAKQVCQACACGSRARLRGLWRRSQ